MPFLKGDNPEATRIHEEYQLTRDQPTFIKAARALIERGQQTSSASQATHSPQIIAQAHHLRQQATIEPPQSPVRPSDSTQLPVLPPTQSPLYQPPPPQNTPADTLPLHSSSFSAARSETMYRLDPSSLFGEAPLPSFLVQPVGSSDQRSETMSAFPHMQAQPTDIHNAEALAANMSAMTVNNDPLAVMQSIWGASPLTPPRSKPIIGSQGPSSPWTGAPSTSDFLAPSFLTPPRDVIGERNNQNRPGPISPSMPLPSATLPRNQAVIGTPKSQSDAFDYDGLTLGDRVDLGSLNRLNVSSTQPATPSTQSPPPEQTRKAVKQQPTRLWTHFEEQPGRLIVNGSDGHDSSLVLKFRPRQELVAYWSLPLKYLQQTGKADNIDQVLKTLAIGLFRRGCLENASQSSIISKFVTERSEYSVDAPTQTVRGKLHFFTPRTPGHVVLRLYWHDDPLYTLAAGPTILVQVTDQDFDSGIRFILSNFKAKKNNPTSLSSLHSLAQVLETPLTVPNESAARAVWGCIQESRKVIEICHSEYLKTCSKLEELEKVVEELKLLVEAEEGKSPNSVPADDTKEEGEGEVFANLREKTRLLMSGRASNLRKWRDAQLAFASILRTAVSNPSIAMLLRRDMITKMRLEFQLWCPLSEEFAIPKESSRLWYEAMKELSNNHSEDFRTFVKHRSSMQLRTLGFEPNTMTLDEVLYPTINGKPKSMDANAVVVLNSMSAAMGKYFRDLYADEERVYRLREMIREKAEAIVTASGAFPSGTRVVIFGSSANGFGSPKSDIDMSLILPSGHEFSRDDNGVSGAMEKLASCLSAAGMEEVDSARLTARIPIIRFFCPNLLPSGKADDSKLIECDLSMHNPLAVLNTSLLRTYAEITPITRVLAAIVKRWAKIRDINNPSRHTLSSYGYILMLLHFLTFHKKNEKGLLEPLAPPEGNLEYKRSADQRALPVLPNLQWVDPSWPKQPQGTPYRELNSLPEITLAHPFEEGRTVNAYFYRPETAADKGNLQKLFPGQDLSLAILLASFFRYYAYEFDYRKCVVSLHSTGARGVVQREVKTELDGWRNYSAALTIEDPFETFYDVAHVMRGGDYHRIRREFAIAYTKIADAVTGHEGSWSGKTKLRNRSGEELLDWICEPVDQEKTLTD